ncbi:MAG: hypothetical protein WD355_08510 [Balneolaceae bacterium]
MKETAINCEEAMNDFNTNNRSMASEREKLYTLLTITCAILLIILFSLL